MLPAAPPPPAAPTPDTVDAVEVGATITVANTAHGTAPELVPTSVCSGDGLPGSVADSKYGRYVFASPKATMSGSAASRSMVGVVEDHGRRLAAEFE
ncbi:hypothetical protein [Williamsia sp. CHRR-6]|uniref:hypothetical protein n=1 Tax=Williamsia sp. CHRR-6 TaxID=2835871 RepID=UPI0027DCB483|nr:hypothetical protein [Williamsia sp. CHRR-6]